MFMSVLSHSFTLHSVEVNGRGTFTPAPFNLISNNVFQTNPGTNIAKHLMVNKIRLIIKAPDFTNDATNLHPHTYSLATKSNMSAFKLASKKQRWLHPPGLDHQT